MVVSHLCSIQSQGPESRPSVGGWGLGRHDELGLGHRTRCSQIQIPNRSANDVYYMILSPVSPVSVWPDRQTSCML